MARIRTIKPEFWTSEQIADCSPIARLLFIGLWNFCDDGGNHPASYRTLKMQIFPGDDFTTSDIERMVDELLRAGLLVKYDADGKAYWNVTGWKHQKIEKPSYKYPRPVYEQSPPNALPFAEHSTNDRRIVADDQPAEWNGEERKVTEKETTSAEPLRDSTPVSAAGSAVAGDDAFEDQKPEQEPEPVAITFTLANKTEYPITERQVQEFTELYPGINAMQQLRSIKAWCMANPTKRKTARGALAFVNNWLNKAQNQATRAAPLVDRYPPKKTGTLHLEINKQDFSDVPDVDNWGIPS